MDYSIIQFDQLKGGKAEARIEIMELVSETIDKLHNAQNDVKKASRKVVAN